MPTQALHRGDHVRTTRGLFRDREAIIEYRSDADGAYSIYIKDLGSVSWYDDGDLALIERSREDLLAQWEREWQAERAKKSDIDWIFANGREVLNVGNGPWIRTLAACLRVSIDDLHGAHGEFGTYLRNARNILAVARPFLESGDKNGFVSYAESLVAANASTGGETK